MRIGASTSNRKNASNGHLLAVFLLVYYWCTRRQKTAAHLTHYPRFSTHGVKKQQRICLIIRVLQKILYCHPEEVCRADVRISEL